MAAYPFGKLESVCERIKISESGAVFIAQCKALDEAALKRQSWLLNAFDSAIPRKCDLRAMIALAMCPQRRRKQ
jgi:hypothetical protein